MRQELQFGSNCEEKFALLILTLITRHRKLPDAVEQTRNVRAHGAIVASCHYVMSSRDTKIKRTLLESGLGLLAEEHEKNPSYGHTRAR